MKKMWVKIILIIILSLGLFLRLNHINEKSLWLDEGITYYNSSAEDLSGVFLKAEKLDQSPPFYYLIMHEYLDVFGENEFGFRFIPVIFGVLSILFLYLLLAKMFNSEIGLIASFLLAINPFHIGFSMESRMYVLLSLESLMAFYFLYKAVTANKRDFLNWILFTITVIFGLYTHNFFIFVLFALGTIFWIFFPAAKEKIFKLGAAALSIFAIFFAFLPWINPFFRQLSVARYWMAENSMWDLKDYMLDFVNKNEFVFWGFLIFGLAGVLFGIFFENKKDQKKFRYSVISLLTFLIIGLLVPLVYSLMNEPILKIRYVVYIVPILLGVVAVGINVLKKTHYSGVIVVLAIVTYMWAPWKTSAYPIEMNENFRELAEIANENPHPVVVHSPSIAHVINFYNQDGKFTVNPFPNTDDLRNFNIEEDVKTEFQKLIKNFSSFYLVISHTHENPGGILENFSNKLCKKSTYLNITGMQTILFEDCR